MVLRLFEWLFGGFRQKKALPDPTITRLEARITELEARSDANEALASLSEQALNELLQRGVESERLRQNMRDSLDEGQLRDNLAFILGGAYENAGIRAQEQAEFALEAHQVVQQYGIRRFEPPVRHEEPKPVITLAELQADPQRYFFRMADGNFLNFPVGLTFEPINDMFRDGGVNGIYFHGNGDIHVHWGILPGRVQNGAIEKLVAALRSKNIEGHRDNITSTIRPFDFLENYAGLQKYIADTAADDTFLQVVQTSLALVKETYLCALEIVAQTRIQDPQDLLQFYQGINVPARAGGDRRFVIKDALLSSPHGTQFDAIQYALELHSPDQFALLAQARTEEIFKHDAETGGLTARIGKPIDQYSVGESVMCAAYVARHIMDNFDSLDSYGRAILRGDNSSQFIGTNAEFIGLTAHYIREYLQPLQPGKFSNWHVGVYDYHSSMNARLKLVHVNPDRTADVYFLDAGALREFEPDALETPEDIAEKVNAGAMFLKVKRTAEDFMYRSRGLFGYNAAENVRELDAGQDNGLPEGSVQQLPSGKLD